MEFMTGVKKTDLLELPELQDKSLAGQTVKVNGAVHTIRDMGDVAFVVLRKRDGLLQCVYEEGKAGFDLKDLKEAATVEMEGILNEEERAPGGIELRIRGLKILSCMSRELPRSTPRRSELRVQRVEQTFLNWIISIARLCCSSPRSFTSR